MLSKWHGFYFNIYGGDAILRVLMNQRRHEVSCLYHKTGSFLSVIIPKPTHPKTKKGRKMRPLFINTFDVWL
jgi:hypothetical protein